MKLSEKVKWLLFCSGVLVAPIGEADAQTSTGIIVESVNNYGGGADCNTAPNLCNSIANGDGFIQGMVFPGSRWHQTVRFTDNNVWDTDFIDPEYDPRGNDTANFDIPGTAVSYFTGHGIADHGCSTVSCSTTAQCTQPNTATGSGVPRLPGTCRFSPMDLPRCCYMVDRAAVTSSTFNKFSGIVNYSGGPTAWGESPSSGPWAGALTNGGANLVVIDISHGVLPTFWYQTLQNANAGVQMIATMMTAGGDTAMVADRGATFATFYRTNENTRVSDSWIQTMNSLSAAEGGSCPGGGGGHGFNGCGCNIIVGMDSTPERADGSMNEGWVHLANDSNDALGRWWYHARWVCNYPIPPDKSAWELP
jgi:hypothetical protein